MKNLWISGIIMGALACPVAYADQDVMAQDQIQLQQTEELAQQTHPKKAKVKKRKHRMHKVKRQHRKYSSNGETAAEKRIDEETDLTNR